MLKKPLLRYLLILFIGTTLFHPPINCSFWSNKKNQKNFGGVISVGILLYVGFIRLLNEVAKGIEIFYKNRYEEFFNRH